jgi:type I restriction enzyme S subunit
VRGLVDLVAKVRAGGFEFKPLGEIGRLVRGNGMPKKVFTNSGVGAIHYGEIYTHYDTWTTESLSFVSPETASRLATVDPGDIIITNTSENLEDVGKAVAWLGAKQIVTGGHATVLKHSEDPKFIAYWLQSPAFFAQKKRLASGTKVIDVSARSLAQVRVPVPPLAVQREIVKVLDLYRALEQELRHELEQELAARRRQFAFYRDSLLARREAVGGQRLPMGELGQFIRGRRFTKKDVVKRGIPSIHYGEIYTHYGVAADVAVSHVRSELAAQLRFAQPGDVVIAAVGETVADVAKAVAWLGNEPVAIHDDTFLFRSHMNPKFVSYAMQSADFHGQKNRHVARAKVKRLSAEGLAKIMIPAPLRSDQDRVVEILDKFGALVDELSLRLPAELNARRKQYEWCRDRLLAFDEAAA